ncbi:8-amino-7-oxononanoate synthase [Bradyrhizobium sp. NAS80.1]|uniref:8-amino-7-oxononanoate synthase n=1 Tax=Bradyrhizobium sp. NAS80.1 TaxID=1680159 RepID=UPI000AFCC528|nr:8-amino-7-oxononanoate synthase [Bradyrhizobium sp. NAS80.1]
MFAQLARYETKLKQLEQEGRRRTLTGHAGLDFTSNDYLGLAGSERLTKAIMAALERGVPAGAGGSRLLRGNHPEHEALETEAAAFFGTEHSLYFGSGYAANLAVLATLPQPDDIVIHDSLVHASAHAGIAAGRASAISVPHSDVGAFADVLRRWRLDGGKGHPWIVVESLYSMDGDRAPLRELAELADRYDGFLFVDEAHATGVHGPNGRGLAAGLEGRDNVIVLHTCGKALGASGALVGASRLLCDYLVNRAKPFIYATAPSPLQAACVREALKILVDEPDRQTRLRDLMRAADRVAIEWLGYSSGSQIQPVMIGANGRTKMVAEHLRASGFDVRAIRPPTVPTGTARLRIAVTLNVTARDIAALFERLGQVLQDEVP